MRKRDYRAEYRRRLERGAERGITRSQARGHARNGETPASGKNASPDKRLRAAVRRFLKTGHLEASAKTEHVSAERLRRELYAQRHAERDGRRLRRLRREMDVPTRGRIRTLKLGFPAASRAGEFLNVVQAFRREPATTQPLLAVFHGQGVTDLSGKFHPFETDPNTLYELALHEGGPFEHVYRLVIPF